MFAVGLLIGMFIGAMTVAVLEHWSSNKNLQSEDPYIRQYDRIRATYVDLVNKTVSDAIIRLSVDEIKAIVNDETDIRYVIKHDFNNYYTNVLYVYWPTTRIIEGTVHQEEAQYMVDFSYLKWKEFVEVQNLLYEARRGIIKQEPIEQQVKRKIAVGKGNTERD